MEQKLDVYIGCPYSHHDERKRHKRFLKVTRISAIISIKIKNIVVYSPITHSHTMAEMYDMPHDWEFWSIIDLRFLELCKVLAVYTLPGWTESVGLSAEIMYAQNRNKPIIYFSSFSEFKREWEKLIKEKIV